MNLPVGRYTWVIECESCGEVQEKEYFRSKGDEKFGAYCRNWSECGGYRDHTIVEVVEEIREVSDE